MRPSTSGFTLVETSISLAVFGILMASVFAITAETSNFLGDNEVETTAQVEGNRAFKRLADVLRKSGRIVVGGIAYPRVVDGGSALEFRVLTDLDGNGYPFDASTAGLEWSNTVYTVKRMADSNFGIYAGPNKVHHLGRFIQNLKFETVAENPALHLKEIRVSYEARRTNKSGVVTTYAVSGSIHMRN
jgi:prepilin-type N-terminal cleavage/methylation domain-containing protein